MISLLVGLLPGILGTVSKGLQQAHRDRLNAKNTAECIEADKRIAALQAQKEIMVAEARTNWNIIFRGFLALPFGLFIWKTVVWDKLLGWGTTDNLSPELWNLMMVVYGFYFVYETAALFKRGK